MLTSDSLRRGALLALETRLSRPGPRQVGVDGGNVDAGTAGETMNMAEFITLLTDARCPPGSTVPRSCVLASAGLRLPGCI